MTNEELTELVNEEFDYERAPFNEDDAAYQYAATHQDYHPNEDLDEYTGEY